MLAFTNTTLAFNRFMHWLIMDKQNGLVRFNDSKVVSNVGELYAKVIRGETVKQKQWLTAADAANHEAAYTPGGVPAAYAANAAANAANAAADDTADYTIYAAVAAVYTAVAAATAADDADDANSLHFEIMADKFSFYLSGQVD